MDLSTIKKELHEYIEDADDRLVTLIHGLVLADKQGFDLPDWHKKIVEERLKEYEKNPGDTVPWEELKASVEKMR